MDENATCLDSKKSKKYPLFVDFINIIVGFIHISTGISVSWCSSQLPKLNGNDQPELNPLPHPITITQEAWIASMTQIGILCGSLMIKYVDKYFGRKGALQLYGIMYLITYLTLALAHYVELFYLGRFIDGFSSTGIFTYSYMYSNDLSIKTNRGLLIGVRLTLYLIGTLYGLVCGPILTVKTFNLLCCLPTIIFLIGMTLFTPQSPVDLARQGKFLQLEQLLMKIRQKERHQITEEFECITELVKKDSKRTAMDIKNLFATKALRKAWLITINLACLIALTGFDVVMAYLQTIFHLANTGLSSYMSVVFVGIVQVFGGICSTLIVDKIGRRKVLLTSLMCCTLSIATLGLYFYLKKYSFNMDSFFWVPLVALLVFVFYFCFGIGFLPYTIASELFLSHIGPLAISCSAFFHCIMNFFVIFLFSYLHHVIGVESFFLFYTGTGLYGLVFVYFMLPETKGRTLQEIQRVLSG